MLKKEYSHFDVSHVTIVTKPNFYYIVHDIVLNDLLLSFALNCGGKWWLISLNESCLYISLFSLNKERHMSSFIFKIYTKEFNHYRNRLVIKEVQNNLIVLYIWLFKSLESHFNQCAPSFIQALQYHLHLNINFHFLYSTWIIHNPFDSHLILPH